MIHPSQSRVIRLTAKTELVVGFLFFRFCLLWLCFVVLRAHPVITSLFPVDFVCSNISLHYLISPEPFSKPMLTQHNCSYDFGGSIKLFYYRLFTNSPRSVHVYVSIYDLHERSYILIKTWLHRDQTVSGTEKPCLFPLMPVVEIASPFLPNP